MNTPSCHRSEFKAWAVREINTHRNRLGLRPIAPHERDDRKLSEVFAELEELIETMPEVRVDRVHTEDLLAGCL